MPRELSIFYAMKGGEKMNIEKIYNQVSTEFGKILPLKIRDDTPTAYFDWESITIPKKFLNWEENMLKNVIRHEFGHLFFSPRDPDVGIIIAYIGSIMGYDNPWIFVNIITDMIVDMTNIELFGIEYLKFLEWSMQDAEKTHGLLKVIAGVYKAKAIMMGLTTRLPEDDTGSMVFKILTDEREDFYKRVIKIARILRQYSFKKIYLHFVIHIYSKNKNCVNIAEALIRKNVKPEDLFDNSQYTNPGSFERFEVIDDPVIVTYKKMKAIAKYMELENDSGHIEHRERISARWNIGDPVETLDIIKTLSIYGILIPGIYSLKAKDINSGLGASEKRYRDCIIILDASGSMDGEKFERAREAAYVIARTTYENGGAVGLIPFSGGVWEEYIIYPTKNIGDVENLLFRLLPNGGTKMTSALKTALSMGSKYYVYVLSDAEVYDVKNSSFLLRRMKNRATFFLISDYSNVNRWFDMNGIKIVEISMDGIIKRVYTEVR